MSGTRREFLRRVAQVGGYRATYLTMQAMGLLGTAAVAEPLALEGGARHGTKVVILGGCRRRTSSARPATTAPCSRSAIAWAAATGPSGAAPRST